MIKTLSIGAGGGSIAWINQTAAKIAQVGPRSAGSIPGPACYNQGGTEPTVTDADVVLGYINPRHLLRRQDAAEPRTRRSGRARENRRADGHRRRRSRRDDPQHRQRQHVQRDHERNPPARLPPGRLRAVRRRRRRAHPRVRGFHGDIAKAVIFRILAGVLRARLVDHGHHARLRDLRRNSR